MSVTGSGTTPTPFGFVGQGGYQSDSDTGLTLCGHRYYDASTGRFLSRDPAQAGYNWYTYCNNDPANCADPEGLYAPPNIGYVSPPTFSPFPGIGGAIPAAPSPTFGGPTGPSLTPPPPGTPPYPLPGLPITTPKPSPSPGPPFPQFTPPKPPSNPAFGPITPQPYPYAPSIGTGDPFGLPNLGIILNVPVYSSPSWGFVISGGPGNGINPKNPPGSLINTGDPSIGGRATIHF